MLSKFQRNITFKTAEIIYRQYKSKLIISNWNNWEVYANYINLIIIVKKNQNVCSQSYSNFIILYNSSCKQNTTIFKYNATIIFMLISKI